jgi:hypothetical protein
VFIFDDIIMESQNIVRSYFSRGRHNQIDVCYLAQSYSCVLIRDNAKAICTHTDKIGTGTGAGAGCNVIKLVLSHIDWTGKFVGPVDDSGIRSRR